MAAENHVAGDIVKITGREYGHMFTIGSLVLIRSVGKDSNGIPYNYRGVQLGGDGSSWAFEDDECSYLVTNNESAKNLLSKDY
jgi:hypothetical protein